jgi:hypothetical protein
MTKVAYNGCFGGFSLSLEAVKRAREISGDPKWAAICLPGEFYDDGSGPVREGMDMYHLDYKHPRTCPILIQVIEEMGEAANGACANLKIEEIGAGTKYRIDEYDGNERVMTCGDYEWETA